MRTDLLIEGAAQLGARLDRWLGSAGAWPELDAAVEAGARDNVLFTPYMQRRALEALSSAFLKEDVLRAWLSRYPAGSGMSRLSQERVCGVVASGNIPAVAFHDILSVMAAGWRPVVKLSSKDRYLLPVLFPDVEFCSSVDGWDVGAIVTMGGDEAASFFRNRFSGIPSLIRSGRFSVAVLDGRETEKELDALAEDMLLYYGLGCRSVTCLLVPRDYDAGNLLRSVERFAVRHLGSLAKNAHRRNRAVLALAGESFLDGGTVILRDLRALCGRLCDCRPYGMDLPLCTAWYAEYEDDGEIREFVSRNSDRIQKIITNFGSAQRPAVDDYPDGVDTVGFLRELKH